MNDRFIRNELLLGAVAMEMLRQARVAVVGMGAVGSFAVEALARAGVGHLRLVDFDTVHASNMNRQLYALESTLGRRKVDVARERVLDINPECDVELLPVFVDETTVGQAIAPPVDMVVDAIDSLSPKTGLMAACARAGVRIISAMGAARKVEPAAIRVASVFESHTCPLARFVRRRLRRWGVTGDIRCVFSAEMPLDTPEDAAAVLEVREEGSYERGRKRQPLGSLACITGLFGLVVAREVIATLTGLDAAAGGRPPNLPSPPATGAPRLRSAGG